MRRVSTLFITFVNPNRKENIHVDRNSLAHRRADFDNAGF